MKRARFSNACRRRCENILFDMWQGTALYIVRNDVKYAKNLRNFLVENVIEYFDVRRYERACNGARYLWP